MSTEQEIALRQQLMLHTAQAIDSEILREYQGRTVFVRTTGDTYSGEAEKIGANFMKLTGCTSYGGNHLNQIQEAYKNLGFEGGDKFLGAVRVPKRTIALSQIEEMVLLADMIPSVAGAEKK